MSGRSEELAARINSVGQLGSVVGALRSIAAAHAQRSRESLAGVDIYAEDVARAIALALTLQPAAPDPPAAQPGPPIMLLFCAEQGFAGSFSQRVFDAAGESVRHACLLVVGRRGQRVASACGLTPDWCTPAIAHVAGAAALADRIATELTRRVGAGNAGNVDILYTRLRDGNKLDIVLQPLLPLDLHRFGRVLQRPPPLVQLEPAVLLQRLAIEYLRAQLTEALLHSFAAENTARMLTMTAAHDNIGRTLESLHRAARIARQESITAEVVELASATAAQWATD
jgi:F-type H+-transporting ATPase subunit gamma